MLGMPPVDFTYHILNFVAANMLLLTRSDMDTSWIYL